MLNYMCEAYVESKKLLHVEAMQAMCAFLLKISHITSQSSSVFFALLISVYFVL